MAQDGVRRGRRFLAYSMGALAGAAAAGRVIARQDGRRLDPAEGDALGAIRGEPRIVRGPRASRLYTEWFPPADGGQGTVVLTHGYCLTEALWHYQKRDVAGGRFGLVTWDLPGHGHSAALGRGRLTLEVSAEALGRVVDAYDDGGGVVLVGHSLGGIVTMAHLVRDLPECRRRVRGLVLVSTPMMHFARSAAGRWPGATLEARALGRVMQYLVESDLAERFLARDVGKEEISGLSYRLVRWGFGQTPSPAQVRFVRDVIACVDPGVRADTYRIMAGYDLTPVLAEIDLPTMVVVGGRDRLVNPEESKILAARLPRGRPVIYADAGHAAFLERHEAFNRDLRRFAERRLRAKAPEIVDVT